MALIYLTSKYIINPTVLNHYYHHLGLCHFLPLSSLQMSPYLVFLVLTLTPHYPHISQSASLLFSKPCNGPHVITVHNKTCSSCLLSHSPSGIISHLPFPCKPYCSHAGLISVLQTHQTSSYLEASGLAVASTCHPYHPQISMGNSVYLKLQSTTSFCGFPCLIPFTFFHIFLLHSTLHFPTDHLAYLL